MIYPEPNGTASASPTQKLAAFVSRSVGRKLGAALRFADTHRISFTLSNPNHGMLVAETVDGYYRIRTRIIISPLPGPSTPPARFSCDCFHSTACIHGEAALVQYALNRDLRTRALLEQAAEYFDSISDEALDFLTILRDTPKATRSSVAAANVADQPRERELFYLLSPLSQSVVLASAKILKRGGYSKTMKSERNWRGALGSRWESSSSMTFSEVDRKIARELFVAGIELPTSGELYLHDVDPLIILPVLAASGRLLGPDEDVSRPLQIGPAQVAALRWHEEPPGRWQLAIEVPGNARARLIHMQSLWYYDPDTRLIGPIANELSPALLKLAGPQHRLSADDLPVVHRVLSKLPHIPDLPPIPTIETIEIDDLRPVPVLTLSHHKSTMFRYSADGVVTMEISFDYDGHTVSAVTGNHLVTYEPGRQIRITRQRAIEDSFIDDLDSYLKGNKVDRHQWTCVLAREGSFPDGGYVSVALEFQRYVAPQLVAKGWRIAYDPDFDLKLISGSSWNMSLDDDERGWYNVRLETEIDGNLVDVIGLLRRLLENPDFVADILAEQEKEGSWWSRVSPDEYMEVPVAVVKRLARLLLDMGDSGGSTPPRVSRFDVAFLEGALAAKKLVIHGAEDLRSLAAALSTPPPPLDDAMLTDLTLPLREYQKEGVAWLRWRLAHGLGVILGDEMAVGKTVQTLVHIWIENRSGEAPRSLIVVPPTLLSKWVDEKEKFLPQMRLGLYHGPSRHGTLAQMWADNHAVLTTYRTLVLDIKEFLAHDWHIVACDEGHDLRNPDADMTQAISALPAKQKVVITGTPLQNKLEDLWAVINIAVPGLLRDRKWFRQRFVQEPLRDPSIGNRRSRLLGQMTAPFRLSRSNKDVGNVLPPVNTVYRHIDMGEEQSEVYETVRAAMDTEVRSLIAESGLAKNQISILAAIGRLRQICCHPALVKSEHVPDGVPSAKLDYLMAMVEELQADGRAVVIVSQWVEMLKIVSRALDDKNVGHRMLYGTGMSLTKRKTALAAFRSGRVRCLLLSLGVGGVGLDIPEGDDIVILDPWWNPKKIEQAIARLTRDDRDKRINAYHLIIKGSLEEGVLKIAERKGEMIAAVMEGGAGGVDSLAMDDIEMLFAPAARR